MRRRGIVLVHGLGEQPKGDTLNYMGRPLVEFVQSNLRERLRMEVAFSPEHGPAHMALRFGQSDGEEEWIIVEAWWARAFVPASKREILQWAMALGAQRPWIFLCTVLRPLLPARLRNLADESGKGEDDWLTKLDNTEYERFRRTPRRGLSSRAWDVIVGVPWIALTFLGWSVSLPVIMVLIGLALIPTLKWPMGFLQEALANFLFSYLGDQYATTKNILARDAVGGAILEIMRPWVQSAPKPPDFESITVVADSGGAVAAFDALTGWELKEWLQSGGLRRPKITLCTTGSALNAGYAMATQSERFWQQRFPEAVRWIDFWTQYDIVPAGRASRRLVRDSGCQEFVDHRVSNQDSPLSDHGKYYENKEEVLSHVLAAILRGENPPKELATAVDKHIKSIPEHRIAVAKKAASRYILGIGAAVGALLLFFTGFIPGAEETFRWLETRVNSNRLWICLFLGATMLLNIVAVLFDNYKVGRAFRSPASSQCSGNS